MYKFFGNITLALKAIFGKKVRSFLTMLGIIIGVFAIVLLIGLGEGVKKEVVGQIEGFGSNLLTIMPGSFGGGPRAGGGSLSFDDIDTVKTIDNIDYVVPIAIAPLPVSSTKPIAPSELTEEQQMTMQQEETPIDNSSEVHMMGGSDMIMAIGSTSEIKRVSENSDAISSDEMIGRMFNEIEYENASPVATVMSGAMGQLFPDESADDVIGKTIYIGKEPFEVIGAQEQESAESSSMLDGQGMTDVVLVPMTAIENLSDNNLIISQLIVSVSDVDEIDEKKEEIRTALLESHEGVEDFSVITQEEILSMLDQVISVITAMLGGIAAISLLVGGIGVMNIMLVSVTERTYEIGLRKAIGASNSDILIQFLAEAIFLTFLGGTLGVAFAFLGSYVMDLKFGLSPSITLQTVLLGYSFTAIVGIVFGVAPAINASRLDPIDALRYE